MTVKVKGMAVLALGVVILCWAAGTARAVQVDNSLYAQLLADHVSSGLVDYDGLKAEEAKLDRYLDILAGTDVDTLSARGRYAYYINLYNAWTLKLILMHYPGIESIKEVGSIFSSPWSREIVRTGGKSISLDDVEHGILRPEFRDYRVHAAINCSAMSCPPLLPEPYEEERLDDQLDQAFSDFVNNPRLNGVEGGTLHLSRIFSWFEEDFIPDPVEVVREWSGPELRRKLERLGTDPDVEYLEYDWRLNALPGQ